MSLIVDFCVVFAMVAMVMVPSCTASGPCSAPILIDESWRDVSNTQSASTDHCDKDVFLPDRWYTFNVAGERAVIPTNCIKNHMCGAEIAMRVNLLGQSLPADEGDNITAVVCGSYNVLGKYDCCVLGTDITIVRCQNDVLVYQFSSSFADRCPVAVCAQKKRDPVPSEATAKTGEDHPASSVTGDDIEEATTTTATATQQDTSDVLRDLVLVTTTTGVSDIANLTTTVSQSSTDKGATLSTEKTTVTGQLTTVGNVTEAAGDLGIFGPVALLEINTTPDQSTIAAPTTSGSALQDSSTEEANASGPTFGSVSLPPSANSDRNGGNATGSIDSAKDSQMTTEPSTDTAATTSESNTTGAPAAAGSSGASSATASLSTVPPLSSTAAVPATTVVVPATTTTSSSAASAGDRSSSLPPITAEDTTALSQSSSQGIFTSNDDAAGKKIPVTTVPSTTSSTTPTTEATTKPTPLHDSVTSASSVTDRTVPSKITAGPSSTTAPPTRRITTVPATDATTARTTATTAPLSTSLPSSSPPLSSSSSSSPSELLPNTSTSNQTVGPADPSMTHEDFIMIEMVRLVFKGSYEGDAFTMKVYGMLESFLRRATRQEKAKDGSDWSFKLSNNLRPMKFQNTTTYLDFRITHSAQMEIFYMFRRLQLQEFISQNSNLTLLADCRPSQNCQEDSFAEEDRLSVFEKHAPVFVTVIVLCSVCLGIVVLGMLCARFRRRGTWRANPDLEVKTLSDNHPYHNGNQSPFTDAQIMKDEVIDDTSFNGSAKDGDNDNNMDNNDNTWVIPLDDAVVVPQDGVIAKTTEDTKF